jgi:GNAT superfamily N-acetyltransferase
VGAGAAVRAESRRSARSDRRLRAVLLGPITEHNISRTSILENPEVGFEVRDDRGAIIAGASGWLWGGTCFIDYLWVSEVLRGQGIGTRLMKAVEAAARAATAIKTALSTYSLQTPGSYERLGFESVGELSDSPAGHRLIHLRKRLDAA